MSVRENLLMGCSPTAREAGNSTSMESVAELFRSWANARVIGGTLSGGEQQMLAIARGL